MKKNNNWLVAAGLSGALAAFALWSNRRGSYDLRGKTVLITGGSRGLGLVLARQAAAEGARVAICARDEAELARARQELVAPADDENCIRALTCDVTAAADVRTLVAVVEKQFGPVDVLINNAGIITAGPLENLDQRDFEECLNTHFWAPFHTMQAVLPAMRRRGEGRIVNISSLGGKVAIPHMAPYTASKFALTGLSEGFRTELSQHGIRVTTVCPGLMRTGSARQALVKGQQQKEYAVFSIADSLPGLTMSAEQAARQIWSACRRGDGEVILSLPAKLLAVLHGVLPGTVTDALGWLNRSLPEAALAPNGSERRKGYESESALSESFLTTLNKKEARKNNELGDGVRQAGQPG